ncbi:hypothetical protein [Thalassoglobus neptunius]|nr:hypothetical protein [Thalassoglobus neptunius]
MFNRQRINQINILSAGVTFCATSTARIVSEGSALYTAAMVVAVVAVTMCVASTVAGIVDCK